MSGNVAEAGTARPSGVAANLKRWAPLVILLGGIAAVYASGLHKYLSLTAIADNRDALMAYVADNSVLAAAAYVAIYVAAVAFSLPGAALLTILGGFLFGWLLGGVFTVAAATAGAVAIFLAAKTSL
ncbi:MAG: TVP38/TMEM64 family protein, partial [Anderseniella sp.]